MAALWLLAATPLAAQTTSASVFGQVEDSQGGVLPGAAVALTSRTQGNTLTATADDAGRFVFPIVRPDTYALRVSMQGFKTLERSNVVVNANDRFLTGVLTLEVGAVTEQVSVAGRVSELQARSGERSFTLESQALQSIANNGRALFTFAMLVPGVTLAYPVDAPVSVGYLTVNGQRSTQNNMTIDGVTNMDTGDNGGAGGNMATTNIDAVSEFKILTNAYQAEYGRAAGGQVQIVTKSGTQAFHGSGYWYGRRSDWNANSWTNKRAAAPPPVGSGALIELPDASRNDYGYTIGGPVYIPGVFNPDKKKLFFFWSQEWQKRKDPVGETRVRVPTALERMGDFSQSVDNNGNPYPYIRDYTTGLPCGASDTRGCFAEGGVLGRIPQGRLYQPGLNALNIYPLPNTTGSSGINYTSQAASNQPRREELARLDFQPSDKWRFTGRYMRDEDTQDLPYGNVGAAGNLDTIEGVLDHPGRNWLLSATGILNATTSLEVSVGSANNKIEVDTTNPALRRAAAGLSALPLLYPDAVQEDYLPYLNFRGGRVGSSAGYIQTNYGPFRNENTTYDALANLTKIWRSHSAKFGVYYQHSYKPQTDFASHNATVNFVDSSANPYDTGFGYANAAIGVFNTYQQASKSAMPEWVYKNLEWYAQDNWKASKRLTLDYGVRFYYLTPQWDQTLQASTFLPDEFDSANAARLYTPVCIGAYPCSGSNLRGMDPALVGTTTPTLANTVVARFVGRLVPGSDRFNGAFQAGLGINDTMQSGNAFRVSPRLGVVYDVSGEGRTIVRGGFGIFYDRPQGNMVFDQIANAPGMLQPLLQWGRLQDLSSSGGDPDPTLVMRPTAYGFKPPMVYAWNVGVQHKLGHALNFDLAYVGSSSKNLLEYDYINAVPLGAKFLPENQDPTRAPSTVPGATALPDDLLRPYQGYGPIYRWGYTGYSNYHSLQTSLNRRFDNGLMFSVFYVWSKALGTGNNSDWSARVPYSTDEENRRVNYSYADYDRPHNFVVNFVYQTPKVAGGTLGLLANDWQISGVYRWTSGTPYVIGYSIPGIGNANLTGNDGNPAARVVVTCDPGKGWSGDPYKQLDASCFAPPQPGSDGTESARFFLHGPPVNNLDLSLSKSFAFGKGIRLEVRLDAFNALNHTQFAGVNNVVSFASLTDPTVTNPAVDANGNVVRNNGFGSINGVHPPRTLQLVTRVTF